MNCILVLSILVITITMFAVPVEAKEKFRKRERLPIMSEEDPLHTCPSGQLENFLFRRYVRRHAHLLLVLDIFRHHHHLRIVHCRVLAFDSCVIYCRVPFVGRVIVYKRHIALIAHHRNFHSGWDWISFSQEVAGSLSKLVVSQSFAPPSGTTFTSAPHSEDTSKVKPNELEEEEELQY